MLSGAERSYPQKCKRESAASDVFRVDDEPVNLNATTCTWTPSRWLGRYAVDGIPSIPGEPCWPDLRRLSNMEHPSNSYPRLSILVCNHCQRFESRTGLCAQPLISPEMFRFLKPALQTSVTPWQRRATSGGNKQRQACFPGRPNMLRSIVQTG